MKVKFNIKKYFQVLGISLAVVAALAAAALGFDFAALKSEPAAEGETNTSVVERNAEKINVLLMAMDIDGLRTDAIMLAQYDVEKNEVNMLSIPRDTKMYVGNRYQKINAAHAFEKNGKIGGAEATVEAVGRITGVPIHYYIDFSFDSIAHVVNEVGPVTFTIPDLYGDGVGMVYDDPVQSLHINLPPGTYELDGQKAVWLMRYRHGNKGPNGEDFKGYVNGDADRVEMQHEFLKALVDQKMNASLILKMPAIFKNISKEIKTNLTAKDVVKYAKYFVGFSSMNIHAYSLPGEYGDDKSNGSIWKMNIEETQKLIQDVFGYDASGITVNNPDDPTATTPPNCVTNQNVSDTPGIAGINNETGEVYEDKKYVSTTAISSTSDSSQSETSGSASGNSSGGSSSSNSSSGGNSSDSSSSSGSSYGSSENGSSDEISDDDSSSDEISDESDYEEESSNSGSSDDYVSSEDSEE